MAAQHGVDLEPVTGTGVGGRIRKQDVLDAAAAKEAAGSGCRPGCRCGSGRRRTRGCSGCRRAPSPLRGTTEPISRLRKVIAEAHGRVAADGAQLTQVIEVDVTAIARLRERVKADFLAREGVKLSYLPFFAKAAIDALKEHPKLNAAIDTEKGEVTYFDRENIAFAVDTAKGLLTPVDQGRRRPVDRRPGQEDRRRRRAHPHQQDRARRAVRRHVHAHQHRQLRGAVRHPDHQPAAGRDPRHRVPSSSVPVVIDDPNLGETIAVRQMVYLSLTYDHRLVDGADAARFLPTSSSASRRASSRSDRHRRRPRLLRRPGPSFCPCGEVAS